MTSTERLSYEHRIEQLEAENQRLKSEYILLQQRLNEAQLKLWKTEKE